MNKIRKIAIYLKMHLLKMWKAKIIICLIFLSLFIFDLITKYVAKNNLDNSIPHVLQVTSSLYFSYNENAGLSFGFLANSIELAISVQVIITLLSIFALFFCSKLEFCFAFLWIAVGGVSNVFDRFDDGNVTDFISFDNKIYFNVADTFVIIGIMFMLYALFLIDDKDDIKIRKLGFSKKN